MSHFAKVENGIVTQVIVAEQDFINTGAVGDPSTWKQTSYNTRGGVHYDPSTGEPSADQSRSLRKNYAGIGYVYDAARDAFYAPAPFASWVIDEATGYFSAPQTMPEDNNTTNANGDTITYTWDEAQYNGGAGNGWVQALIPAPETAPA